MHHPLHMPRATQRPLSIPGSPCSDNVAPFLKHWPLLLASSASPSVDKGKVGQGRKEAIAGPVNGGGTGTGTGTPATAGSADWTPHRVRRIHSLSSGSHFGSLL